MTETLNDFATALLSLSTAPLIVGAVLGTVVLLWYMIIHDL
jgi:hypothetical protein